VSIAFRNNQEQFNGWVKADTGGVPQLLSDRSQIEARGILASDAL